MYESIPLASRGASMGAWNPQANDIFLKATEIAGVEQRRAYLDEVCAGNADLRADVDSLIAAGERATGFMESSADGLSAGVASELAAEWERAGLAQATQLESVGT